jgi:hypothetical protein
MFTSALAIAQDTTLARKYQEKTIFVYGGKYLLDNQRLPKSSLKLLLNKYPESRNEFEIFRKWKTGANILNAGSLAFYMAAISQLINYNYQKFQTFVTASFVTSMISLPIGRQAKKHFDKSVWLYNKNTLIY